MQYSLGEKKNNYRDHFILTLYTHWHRKFRGGEKVSISIAAIRVKPVVLVQARARIDYGLNGFRILASRRCRRKEKRWPAEKSSRLGHYSSRYYPFFLNRVIGTHFKSLPIFSPSILCPLFLLLLLLPIELHYILRPVWYSITCNVKLNRVN